MRLFPAPSTMKSSNLQNRGTKLSMRTNLLPPPDPTVRSSPGAASAPSTSTGGRSVPASEVRLCVEGVRPEDVRSDTVLDRAVLPASAEGPGGVVREGGSRTVSSGREVRAALEGEAPGFWAAQPVKDGRWAGAREGGEQERIRRVDGAVRELIPALLDVAAVRTHGWVQHEV